MYIGHLGVKPELRGQGVGRALIQQMCEIAKEKNIQYLSLDVATKNPMAQTLYEELDFVVKALRPFKYQQPSNSQSPIIIIWSIWSSDHFDSKVKQQKAETIVSAF